jgi:hypothetical protein
MTNDKGTTKKPDGQNEALRRWGMLGAALLGAFLLGLVPMWLSSRAVNAELVDTRTQLHRSQLENTLAAAVIDARRGKYEEARQEASKFFGEVRNELDDASSERLSAQEKARVSEHISNRDEIITLLSRADSAGAERLSELYVSYRQTMRSAGSPGANSTGAAPN